jgi:hypothetical protein
MSELYPAPKWRKHESAARTIHSTKDKRVEVLWTNHDLDQSAAKPVRDLFDDAELDQPDSSVGLPLKEAFLALRRAAITTD